MRLHLLFAVGVTLLVLRSARGDVIFNLTPSALTTSPGGTVEFTGTLTNTGSTDVFLNGDSAGGLPPILTLDDSPFFGNAPLFLTGTGGFYSGPFFDVMVVPAALPGIYSGGSFTIQGGADSNTFDGLASQNFQVTVTSPSSIPEPGSFVLVATAFAIILFARRSFSPRFPIRWQGPAEDRGHNAFGIVPQGDFFGKCSFHKGPMPLKNTPHCACAMLPWKSDAIRSAIGNRWPPGRHFLSPDGIVGPSQKSFSTASTLCET